MRNASQFKMTHAKAHTYDQSFEFIAFELYQ